MSQTNSRSTADQALAEALRKWERHKKDDPLPDVRRTLLSADDIKRYVEKVGLIHPFRLKGASYEVGFGNGFIYWNQNGKKIDRTIKETDIISLPANSIGFVELESEFLLPYYIAARFNLRIQHVHRGLLARIMHGGLADVV